LPVRTQSHYALLRRTGARPRHAALLYRLVPPRAYAPLAASKLLHTARRTLSLRILPPRSAEQSAARRFSA
jgi:hypothetical protein